MEYTVEKNDFTVDKIPTSTNTQLHDNFEKVFDKIYGQSGGCVNINGSANSGKTNLLLNLFTKKKNKQGKKRNLEGIFDNIFVVSPNLKSLKKNIFDDLEPEYLYNNLRDFLDSYRDIIENNMKYDDVDDDYVPETIIVFDDVGNQVKKNGNLKDFEELVCNRRHDHIFIINLTQRIIQIPPIVRENLSALITFFLKTTSDENFIYDEYTKFEKKYKKQFFEIFFKEPYDFMMIDLSLKKSHTFEYYRKYEKINFKT